MSGEFPFATKVVSPVKCNEKPWDLWVGEIGHSSPRPDDEAAAAPVKRPRYRRAGLNRLKFETMSLHGLFPQMDNLNAAVCHMCGVVVKCSAAYRHLLESHNNSEPLLPPPPPAPTVKHKSAYSRSRHKKEVIPPPPPIDLLPVKMDASPIHTAATPLNRIVLPQPEVQYIEEPTSTVTGEVQVSMESGELPVVSIQDTEDLPLGENLTDDIFAIMNSEGIQSADDITNVADWKNIIRDIGNMQEINFPNTSDGSQSQELYAPVDTSTLSAYTISDADLASIHFAPSSSPMIPTTLEPLTTVLPPKPTPPPPLPAVTTPTTKTPSRSKAKSKFSLREYDPNKHCGVVTADNPKPCTRSLTCKAHALSLRRTVEGRVKPFDTLLAEHRAAREAPAVVPVLAPPPPAPLLVNPLDLGAFNGIPTDQQVSDIYATLLSVEDPTATLPDTSGITSLLSQPLPTDPAFLLPEEAEPPPEPAKLTSPTITHIKSEDISSDVCWYSASPRPLALCTFNASHAGGAVALGKRFATVRSNIKSSLSRSQSKSSSSGSNNYYMTANSHSLSKSVHMNSSSKSNKPEVRKLIVTMGSGVASGPVLSSLLEPRLNGHVGSLAKRPLKTARRQASSVLDLGFSLDPLLDEKC